ncbi:MAG: transcriptional regulator [Anaerolineae bacterium]|nr:transcriptional regulator [Anaerolineae bacterium]
MTTVMKEIQPHWAAIRPYLSIRNEAQYQQAVNRLNELLDEVSDDESHPLYEFLDTLGTMVQVYEEKHYPLPTVSGAEVLQYLMVEHNLRQSDLPEVGSQGVVSEILNGKRELNVRQIRELAQRFHVSPAVFI